VPISPAIHILTPSLVPFDAIGNDVIQMRAALESEYSVNVFAESIHPTLSTLARPLGSVPDKTWQSPDDIFIYHHSMGWPMGERILFETRNKITIRYHNITPHQFFTPYSLSHERACRAGADSTKRIADIPNTLILGDSTFNCEGFIALGVAPAACRVLAPFHLTEDLGREQFDMSTVQRYFGDVVNLLFVGGIKPNKGHARAIRAFAAYHAHFNHRSRLIFAGGIDGRLDGYVQDLRRLAASLDVEEHVLFTGSVSGSQLKTLYTIADVFLCTSEHEGFCVPLVEAMYFRNPIVAWGVTAVSETLGNCGIVLEEWDEYQFASQIAKVIDDSELAVRLGALGRQRYQNFFAPNVLQRRTREIIGEIVQRSPTDRTSAVACS
jgi:glycosyltransferase involved in cell wall biosynthesis